MSESSPGLGFNLSSVPAVEGFTAQDVFASIALGFVDPTDPTTMHFGVLPVDTLRSEILQGRIPFEFSPRANLDDINLLLDVLNLTPRPPEPLFDYISPALLPAAVSTAAATSPNPFGFAFGFNPPTPTFPFGSTNFFGMTFANNEPSTSPNFGWTETFNLTSHPGDVTGPGVAAAGGVSGVTGVDSGTGDSPGGTPGGTQGP